MPELPLKGCTSEPLMSYLKALGVLRLICAVGEHGDPYARAAWKDGTFILESNHEEQGLIDFFLKYYEPSPIIAPWAGGSGFFGSDNRTAVDTIAKSTSQRLARFADLISKVRTLLKRLSINEKPANEMKDELLRHYRRELPDEFVVWMDTAIVLQSAGQAFPPLLGTGGNDGRLDFTQNYMQRLVALGFGNQDLNKEAEPWLRQTLFGEAASGLLAAAVGQFDPGRSGGPNATTGLEGASLVNPWDFVFMLEGSIVLAGAAVRRMGANQRDRAAFPFTVRQSSVGYGSASDQEESRGEIWLPLWNAFTSLSELTFVFAEGRSEYSGRQSREGIDFARAVATLGVDRGFIAFTRYGFLKRSGKAFVAAPLGVFPVQERQDIDLLHRVDAWLERFKRECAGDDVPSRFKTAHHRIASAIFDCSKYGGKERFADVLAALGSAERELASGDMPQDKRRARSPLAGLSSDWIEACNDGSLEYRLARSLASLYARKLATVRS